MAQHFALRSGLLYRFGVDAEHILDPVYGLRHVFVYLLCKACRLLRRTLNYLRLIRCDRSSLHSLCRRWNRKFSLSKPKASAVITRATTSRSENLGTLPHLGTFPSSFARFLAKSLQIPKILTNFAMKLRLS